jgi:GT2 family glycosyltransferase
MGLPGIHIVVLNFNEADELPECLGSIFGISYPDFRVTIVDNGSTDGSLETVKAWAAGEIKVETPMVASHPRRTPLAWQEFAVDRNGGPDLVDSGGGPDGAYAPRLRIIASRDNLGFAGGHNLGIRMALEENAPFVLLLNSDMVVDPGFLEPLIDAARPRRIGAAGPVVFHYGELDMVWQAGARILPARGWVEGLDRGRRAETLGSGTRPAHALAGCAVLLKAEALAGVGLLDDDYFLYLEDSDWFARAAGCGWEAVVALDSKVWHKESPESIRVKSAYGAYYFARNRLIFTQKNYPSRLPLALVWSLRYGILNNLLRRRPRHLISSLAGTWDFLRGKRGRR